MSAKPLPRKRLKKATLAYTFFHDVNGTLEIRYPRGCTVELGGSRYHGWELIVEPKKGIRKRKVAKAAAELSR